MINDRLLHCQRALQDAQAEGALRVIEASFAERPPSRERITIEGTLRTLRVRAGERN